MSSKRFLLCGVSDALLSRERGFCGGCGGGVAIGCALVPPCLEDRELGAGD